MKNWRLHRVTASLMVRVTKPMPDLTPPIEAEIDAIWRMEQSRLGNVLFNGRVFSGDVITPELVTGHWTEYRRIVAQLRRPELYEHIRIRPLAVGGVIQSPDGFIFGRRQPAAPYPRHRPAVLGRPTHPPLPPRPDHPESRPGTPHPHPHHRRR